MAHYNPAMTQADVERLISERALKERLDAGTLSALRAALEVLLDHPAPCQLTVVKENGRDGYILRVRVRL